MELLSEPSRGSDSPLLAARPKLKLIFRKLDRMLTAIAYAEAGNLDAVKEILEQNKTPENERDTKTIAVPSQASHDMRSANPYKFQAGHDCSRVC